MSEEKLQKAYIYAPMDLFVRCPECNHENWSKAESHILNCEKCNFKFYAEFDCTKVIAF